MAAYSDPTGDSTRPVRRSSAWGVAAALLPLVAASGFAALAIGVCGGVQYRALRQIIAKGGGANLFSVRTPLGLKFRYLDVSRGTWSWSSGVPVATLLIPARSVNLWKHCTDEDLRGLGNLSGLRSLFVMRSKVTDRGMHVLSKLRQLRSLTIIGAGITDAGLRGLPRLRRLKKLLLEKVGVDDRVFALIAPLDNLQTLSLAGDIGVMAERMHRAAMLPRLERLYLDGTRFGDAGLRWVGALPDLKYLNLASDSAVTGNGLRSLAGLSRLRELDLSGTRITDRDLHWIAAMRALRIVSLEKTRCSEVGIAHLRRIDSALRVRY
jgi:hypothetical protein